MVLHSGRARLGDPETLEWEWFVQDRAQQTALEVRFTAQANPTEATLFIRQQDVKLDWRVSLNGKTIGKLAPMEHDLVHWLAIPPATLRDGENVLSISTLPGNADDIVIRDIVLDPGPMAEAIGQASLRVTVREKGGKPLPARVTVTDDQDTLVPLIALPGETLAARAGVAYTGNGQAGLGVRPGKYTVRASRGFEYGTAAETIEIRAGETKSVDLQIAREVPTPGFVASDTHIHTLTLSGHGDCTLDERMLTIAGEGIELPVATEHNRHADYAEAARRMGVSEYFTTVRGNEFTTSRGHFNVFPVDPEAAVPNAKLTAWPEILRAARAVPGTRVVQLNHPRSIHDKFRPFDPLNFNTATGENRAGLDLSFDLIEALNSGAQQTDYMLVLRDWFALLNRGHRMTAVGASDSHDVSRFIVGQARTYIQVTDANPAGIDIATACEALKAGRANVSMGLLPEIRVEEKYGVGELARDLPEAVQVRVRVLGPSWVRADRVQLFANGEQIKDEAISTEHGNAAGVKAEIAWTIPRPARDTFLVAVATGPAVTAQFWLMTRPYQPTSNQWTGRAIGLTNPVWLDADGDGRFTAMNEGAAK
jgi:hypothetical protein